MPVTCDPPPHVPMGVLSSVSGPVYSAGDEASYDCVPGHSLVTSGPMMCGVTGQWSADPPQCVPQLCSGPGAVSGGSLVIGSWTLEPLPERTVEILREEINKLGSVHKRHAEAIETLDEKTCEVWAKAENVHESLAADMAMLRKDLLAQHQDVDRLLLHQPHIG